MKTQKEIQIINTLKKLEKVWPKNLYLFSWNGDLVLYRGHPLDNGEELYSFPGIKNDGGEPDESIL